MIRQSEIMYKCYVGSELVACVSFLCDFSVKNLVEYLNNIRLDAELYLIGQNILTDDNLDLFYVIPRAMFCISNESYTIPEPDSFLSEMKLFSESNLKIRLRYQKGIY